MTDTQPLVQRLDHIIFCARDRHAWAGDIERVLGLTRGRGRDSDDWGFSNWEFDVGDGFLGLVSPDGEGSLLDRFLGDRGDRYYAISVQVSSITDAAAHWDANGVAYRPAMRDGKPVLLWPKPAGTGGVLFQVIEGVEPKAGANRNLQGLRRVIVATPDRNAAAEQLQVVFRLGKARQGHDERIGANTSVLPIPSSALGNEIVLAEPVGVGLVSQHLERFGPSIFEWTFAVGDVDAEVSRLASVGMKCSRDGNGTAFLPSDALGTMRLAFHQRT
jgi:hypothetical protein